MMDDFDESVTEAEETERGGKMALIAVFIGIVGIIVGATGIVLANKAEGEIKTLEAKLSAQPDKIPELETDLEDLDARLVKLGGEFVKLGRQDRQLQENTQAAFNEVAGNIAANREALNELSTKLTELVEKLESRQFPVRTTTTSSTESSDGESTPAEAAPEEGVYLIQSGDTLSAIAKRFGVSLNALLAANPTVNPRALQIGQRIVIPSN
ncbi:MAG: LysM peptidoglycan-binding domain-containing protein [Puniceicoccaceae bacterium]